MLSSELAILLYRTFANVLNSRVSISTLYLRSTTIVTRLTEHGDVIKSLLRGTPRLGLALDPAPARTGPAREVCLRINNSLVDYLENYTLSNEALVAGKLNRHLIKIFSNKQ